MYKFLKKRWPIVLIAIVIAPFIGYPLINGFIASIIGGKIKDAVASHLRADLQYDSISYHFPYAVQLQHVQMFSNEAQGHVQLLAIDRLDLTLAELPRAGKPIVVKNLELIAPTFHLIHTQAGLAGKTDSATNASASNNSSPPHKLSEMFELRQFKITGGTIAYEDHTDPSAGVASFGGIDVDLGVTPKSKAIYSFHVAGSGIDYVNLDADGTMNIDQLLLKIDQFTMRADTQMGKDQSALPPQLQKVMNDAGATGAVEIHGTATLPLRDMARSEYSGQFALTNGGARFGGQAELRELNLLINASGTGSLTKFEFAKLQAKSGEIPINVEPFTVQSNAGAIALSNVILHYGGDLETLHTASITTDGSHESIAISNLAADIHFSSPRPRYPAAIERIFSQAGPTGMYAVSGSMMFHRTPGIQRTIDLAIHTEGGAVTLTDRKIPITNVKADMHIGSDAVQIDRADGDMLGGKVAIRGKVNLQRPLQYDGDVTADGVDLAEVAKVYALPEKDGHPMSGRANLAANFSGVGPHDQASAIDGLTSQGDLEITGGELWQIPLLGQIAGETSVKKEALTAGDAAAVFRIEKQTITLRHAAINSPLLGLQGKGTITFDKQVDLTITAAPLGDWRNNLKSTNIPIISDVAGDIAGGIQHLVSAATRKLLFEFHVTGPIGDPQIKTIPSPVLTDAGAVVFGKMMREMKQHELLDLMNDQK